MEFKLKQNTLLRVAILAVLAGYTMESWSNTLTHVQTDTNLGSGAGTTITGGTSGGVNININGGTNAIGGSSATTILVDAGTQHTANSAFYGFTAFQLANGDTLTFNCASCNTTAAVSNVFVRDSGANDAAITANGPTGLSLLAGNLTFGSNISSNAALWFFNPNGVVFGNGGIVNVPAAFHVGNASQISFGANSAFSMTTTDASSLTTASPAAFGFVGTPVGSTVTLDGTTITAGDGIEIKGSSLVITTNQSTLNSDGSTTNSGVILSDGATGQVTVDNVSATTTVVGVSAAATLSNGTALSSIASISNSGSFVGDITSTSGSVTNAATGNITGSINAGTDITNNGVITLSATAGPQTVEAGHNLILDGTGGASGTGVILDNQGSGATATISAGNTLEIGNTALGGIYKSGASGNLTVETTGNSSTLSINNSGSQISDASTGWRRLNRQRNGNRQ